MTIEEKAKAYDEAIGNAEVILHTSDIVKIVDIFPQLAESEDDRIRKEMIDFLNQYKEDGLRGVDITPWISYLEKQKDQKPFPKFRIGDRMRTKQEASEGFTDCMPVIVAIDDVYYYCTNEKIPIVKQDEYEYPPVNIEQKPARWSEEDEKVRKWILSKIQEMAGVPGSPETKMADKAIDFLLNLKGMRSEVPDDESYEEGYRDGFTAKIPVLPAFWSAGDEVNLSKLHRLLAICQGEKKFIPTSEYEKLDSWLNSLPGRTVLLPNQEWSEDEIRKIFDDFAECKDTYMSCINRLMSLRPKSNIAEIDEYEIIKKHITEGSLSSEVNKRLTECGWYVTEQAPKEWSKEDDKRVQQLIYDTEHIRAEYEVRKKELGESFNDNLIKDCDDQIAWLQSLPLNLKKKNEDVAKLCSNEWSEADEKALDICYDLLLKSEYTLIDKGYFDNVQFIKDWLRSLPERFNLEPKQEWSEKDKQMINRIIGHLSGFIYPNSLYGEDAKECIDWLKSFFDKKNIENEKWKYD